MATFFALNTGARMPSVGLGTWQAPPGEVADAVIAAVKPTYLLATWAAMEKLYDSGKARAIGMSNFSTKKLVDLLAIARVPPVVNQVERHPVWQQAELRKFCESKNAHLSAYSPLGSPGTPIMKGGSNVLTNPVVTMFAEKLGKTAAQVYSPRAQMKQGGGGCGGNGLLHPTTASVVCGVPSHYPVSWKKLPWRSPLRPPPSLSLEGNICRATIGERTPLSFPSLALFSSAAKKPASDANLLCIIDDEIKYAEDSDDHDRVEEIPKGFPFEIQDEREMNVITLKRSYQGEKIEVVVSMPSLVTGEEPNNGMEDDHDEDEDGGRGEKPSQSSIPLTVNVSKGDGPGLEFCCTAYPDEVTIDSMSVSENKESGEEMIAYEGPDFNDLDENLQKAFHKYLEMRGISNTLHEYMINKDSREYLHWSRNLKQFVQK
ncbi:hypothetical protein COCNU_04G001300 [Cocos nucifera]|uniref:NADP-dependent oxidoreductase domain-containing protein n=1 Tax=Cocos nucifera TaxID=13894 RepID=A0A8K0I544_COCNU|nr:hypothetical protein COCNU_04G001300 [Cocos nucifera]